MFKISSQYIDIIYQRDKYRRKYKEEQNKNASLLKEINKMRERQDNLYKEICRLEEELDRVKRSMSNEKKINIEQLCAMLHDFM